MPQLTLIRHGESCLTSENRFAGWTDSRLSEKGYEEAKEAGRMLIEADITDFDGVFTSVLKRTIISAQIILEIIDRCWIPHIKAWQLNERHYGQLEGRNKVETAQEFGKEQVQKWRRSFHACPPAVGVEDPRNPANQLCYKKMSVMGADLPCSESPADCFGRVYPYFEREIRSCLKMGKNILVVSHGTALRSIMKLVEGLSDEAISAVEIPSGVPVCYELEEVTLKVKKKVTLMEEGELRRREEKIRNQADPEKHVVVVPKGRC